MGMTWMFCVLVSEPGCARRTDMLSVRDWHVVAGIC